LISILSEIIIPRTDTPGAIDAGVPMFIDKMLKDVYPKESQEEFLKNLTAFNDGASATYNKTFLECSDADKLEYFKKHHDEAVGSTTSSYSSGFWNSAVKVSKPFILEVKELTLLGFFTSEPGATQVLQYNQVPGPYKGCVPLSTVGKAWAT
jgi:gluconate 2-dehydrogenase gamma chain